MATNSTLRSMQSRPLRLWPGVASVVLGWASWFIVPAVAPDKGQFGMLGWLAGGLLVLLWWLFFSRARWSERLAGVALMALGVIATHPLLHESIATAGMGVLYYIFSIPVMTSAFVAWAMTTRNLEGGARWVTMVATILIVCVGWTLLRTGGVDNSGGIEFAWRWSPTPEERLLARAGDEATTLDKAPAAASTLTSEPDWPGFRGAGRDSHVAGTRIATDWSASPPAELWRRPVGPGWSSFAVHGNFVYTQEQRGQEEVVSCYDARTGEPVWQHGDPTRFWEANAGAGPRATPTLHEGRVYSFGANGWLNVLDAGTGKEIWSRDVSADTAIEVPIWGFSSSPLVVDGVVVVAAVGKLAAYDIVTGEPRWYGPDGGDGYSSPHLLTLHGVEQVVLMSQNGAVSVSPADGSELWSYDWKGGTRIVQPALTDDGDLLMSRGVTTALRRVSIESGPGSWAIEERWTTNRLKPYFSDFVVHDGHAYGFDGNIMAAIDVETGERAWKGGRYGSGQLLLLADQDLLLVISEQGELALVSATPEKFTELARMPAVEGKTWNHPVVVGDLLLVRNDREMVAYRLPMAAV